MIRIYMMLMLILPFEIICEDIENGKKEIGLMFSPSFDFTNSRSSDFIGITFKEYNKVSENKLVPYYNIDFQYSLEDNNSMYFLTFAQGLAIAPYNISLKENWLKDIIKLHFEGHFGICVGTIEKNDNQSFGLMGNFAIGIGYKPFIFKFGVNYYTNLPINRMNTFNLSYIF